MIHIPQNIYWIIEWVIDMHQKMCITKRNGTLNVEMNYNQGHIRNVTIQEPVVKETKRPPNQ